MTSVRAAKWKGSEFEYSIWDSLKPIYPNIKLTKQLGFVQQYDLIIEESRIVIEAKRHKSFSWNELEKTFQKLKKISREKLSGDYIPLLIFQANRQPPLVMFETMNLLTVRTFESYFKIEFTKHGGKKDEPNV